MEVSAEIKAEAESLVFQFLQTYHKSLAQQFGKLTKAVCTQPGPRAVSVRTTRGNSWNWLIKLKTSFDRFDLSSLNLYESLDY